MSDDDIASATRDIAELLCVALERRRTYWPDYITRVKAQRVICEGCGCLCWPDEACPGCKARRLSREAA